MSFNSPFISKALFLSRSFVASIKKYLDQILYYVVNQSVLLPI